MAAEAEHARPGGQAQAAESGKLAQADAFGDEAPGVLANGKVGELVGGGDAPVECAGALGGLGALLGHVSGDLRVAQIPGRGDWPDVVLASPGQDAAGQAADRADLLGARLSGIMYSAKECLRVRWMHPIAGGPMPSGDEIRDVQRATWAGLSGGWEKWDSVIMDQLGPVGTAIIERLDIADDQQHLDIAAGTGEPGLTVAKLAPRGHVVLTDLAAEMLDIATRRANAQGITNFETKVCSADDLPFGDATFDSISVRFGYMFFPDVAKATAEFARVLKPGGRLCSSVWVKPEENPWTTIAMQAIATEAALAPPDPDGPNMFRCAAPGYVSALYEAAGLRDVAERNVDVELVTRSPAQYWEMISDHVSLAVAALQQVDESARERIAKAVIAKVSTYEEDGKVRIPGVARCIVGTK